MENVLTVQNVSFSYRNKYQTVNAVKRADCSFERGKAYAIVGKSGSGKTTLLSLLAGLELPGGGTILFDGKSTQEMDRDAYRRDNAAVIYQNYNLFPLLTVMENVLYSIPADKKFFHLCRVDLSDNSVEELDDLKLATSTHLRFNAMDGVLYLESSSSELGRYDVASGKLYTFSVRATGDGDNADMHLIGLSEWDMENTF